MHALTRPSRRVPVHVNYLTGAPRRYHSVARNRFNRGMTWYYFSTSSQSPACSTPSPSHPSPTSTPCACESATT